MLLSLRINSKMRKNPFNFVHYCISGASKLYWALNMTAATGTLLGIKYIGCQKRLLLGTKCIGCHSDLLLLNIKYVGCNRDLFVLLGTRCIGCLGFLLGTSSTGCHISVLSTNKLTHVYGRVRSSHTDEY